MLIITALYAGVLGIMNIALAFASGRLRGATKISVGDGGDPDLLLAMRRHANFIEYVPMFLVILAVLETNGVAALPLHVLGAGMVIARVLHATSLRGDTMQGAGRAVGAAGTALVTVVASVWAITTFF